MQLLRLELKGFKSFADKTVVKFSPGMTAGIGLKEVVKVKLRIVFKGF